MRKHTSRRPNRVGRSRECLIDPKDILTILSQQLKPFVASIVLYTVSTYTVSIGLREDAILDTTAATAVAKL